MNIRFESTKIIDVSTLNFCSYCFRATASDSVHFNGTCILKELNLISGVIDQTILINYEFYQCFLKNCSFTSKESYKLSDHLSHHGISLKVDKAPHKCPHCSYGTSRKRQLENHISLCRGEQPETSSALTSRPSFKPKRKRISGSKSSNVTIEATSSSLQILDEIGKTDRSYSCSNCPYTANHRRYLTIHINRWCKKGGDRKFVHNDNPKSDEKLSTTVSPEVSQQSTSNLSTKNTESENEKRPTSEIRIQAAAASVCRQTPDTVDNDTIKHKTALRKQELHAHHCSECNYSTTQKRYMDHHVDKYQHSAKCNTEIKSKIMSLVVRKKILSKIKKQRKVKKVDIKGTSVALISTDCAYSAKSIPAFKCLTKGFVRYANCDHCPYRVGTKGTLKSLKAHQIKCGSGLYDNNRCKICNDIFISQPKLQHHSLKHFFCKTCPFTNKSASKMLAHRSLCKDKNIIRCSQCHYVTKYRGNYARHLKVCVFPSNVDKSQKTSSHFSSEVSSKHNKELLAPTDLVSVDLTKKSNNLILYNENKQVDAPLDTNSIDSINKPGQCKLKRFSCPKCSYKSSVKKSVLLHIPLCKTGLQTVYRCSKCDYISMKLSYITHHHSRVCHTSASDTITEEPPYKILSSDVNVSRKINTKKLWQCPTCPCKQKPLRYLLHQRLCLMKSDKENANKVLSCNEDGCYFLTLFQRGLAYHRTKVHGVNQTLVYPTPPLLPSQQASNLPDPDLNNTWQNSSLPNSEDIIDEETFVCESCSYKCPVSDTSQISSHKELNCRMQLFDKLKIRTTKLKTKAPDTFYPTDEKPVGTDDLIHEQIDEEIDMPKTKKLKPINNGATYSQLPMTEISQLPKGMEELPSQKQSEKEALEILRSNRFKPNDYCTLSTSKGTANIKNPESNIESMLELKKQPLELSNSESQPFEGSGETRAEYPETSSNSDEMLEHDLFAADNFGDVSLCLESEYFL